MSGFEATREQIQACQAHVMWGTIGVEAEFVECSCGWRWETTFDDYCAISDIEFHSRHPRYVIAYPETEDLFAGVMLMYDGDEFEMSRSDLEWLLVQPGLPDEFRRAAAVHLEK